MIIETKDKILLFKTANMFISICLRPFKLLHEVTLSKVLESDFSEKEN